MAKRNLKRVSDAGIRIAFGTDTGPAGRFQGFFEHLELEMMVAAGSHADAGDRLGHGQCGGVLGKQGQLGTIARGAAGDLLVLNANPLDAITNTRAIDAIYIGGRRLDAPR